MHYHVLVVGSVDEVDSMLAPYDENIEVEPYISSTRKELIEDGRVWANRQLQDPDSYYHEYLNDPLSLFNHYSYIIADKVEKFFKELPNVDSKSDDEFWEIYPFKAGKNLDEDGNEISTYNPDSKWDWYQVGGRWAGGIKLKDTVDYSKYELPNFSWGWSEDNKAKRIVSGGVDSAMIKDIADLENLTTYSYLDKNGWEDKDDFISIDYKNDTDEEINAKYEKWNQHVLERLKNLSPETWITVVDCHI